MVKHVRESGINPKLSKQHRIHYRPTRKLTIDILATWMIIKPKKINPRKKAKNGVKGKVELNMIVFMLWLFPVLLV